jgi:putative heme iron utilization protein
MAVTFKNRAAQGDLLLRRIKSLPEGLKRASAENGQYIISHSETGHHHVVAERPNVALYNTVDPLVSYLEVVEATDATETLLEHLRAWDTHETIKIPPGIFELRRQREYVPEGWRRVAD